VLLTHCISTVAPIVFKCRHCLQHVCNLLFIVLLYWSCAILDIFSLYLSVISLIPAVHLFTHSLHSLPTIIYSSPEILIMNKRKKKCCPHLSQFSPVPFHCLTVQYHVLEHRKPMHLAHTVYCSFQMSYRFAQISPSQIMVSIFNTNCVFGLKNFEIPVTKCRVSSKCVIMMNVSLIEYKNFSGHKIQNLNKGQSLVLIAIRRNHLPQSKLNEDG
jgi:hypothetical protein